VDPVPDPLLLRKSGSAGDRNRDLCICSQKLWPLDHRLYVKIEFLPRREHSVFGKETAAIHCKETMKHKYALCAENAHFLRMLVLAAFKQISSGMWSVNWSAHEIVKLFGCQTLRNCIYHGGEDKRWRYTVCKWIVWVYPYSKTNQMHLFLIFIFGMKLYLFRTVPMSVIRSFLLYTHQWYMSQVCWQLASRIRTEPVLSWSCSQTVYKPVWHIPLLCIEWKTPDDGQRNCPKHVEFHSKIK